MRASALAATKIYPTLTLTHSKLLFTAAAAAAAAFRTLIKLLKCGRNVNNIEQVVGCARAKGELVGHHMAPATRKKKCGSSRPPGEQSGRLVVCVVVAAAAAVPTH